MAIYASQNFKLSNLEHMPVIKEYFARLANMYKITSEYLDEFRKIPGCEKAQVNMHTDYTAGFKKVNGFGVPVNLADETIEKRVEIFHKDLNTFAKRRAYQPLRKNKHNREKTNNFEDLQVSYTPVLEVIYGDPSPFKFIEGEQGQPELLVKALSFKMDGENFIIRVLEEDVNEHLLANFEPIEKGPEL